MSTQSYQFSSFEGLVEHICGTAPDLSGLPSTSSTRVANGMHHILLPRDTDPVFSFPIEAPTKQGVVHGVPLKYFLRIPSEGSVPAADPATPAPGVGLAPRTADLIPEQVLPRQASQLVYVRGTPVSLPPSSSYSSFSFSPRTR